MTRKTRYVGKESGKSSTRWFGRSDPPDTAAGQHGRGARAGDGRTTNKTIAGKIVAVFKSPPKEEPKKPGFYH